MFTGMKLNYILLVITGLWSLANIISLSKHRGWIGRSGLYGVIVFVLFVMVLIATMMGMDYESFKIMIESGVYNQ